MPLRVKVTAVLLYLSGLSMNRTAKLLGVSTPSVMTWIERFAKAYAQKPEPEGRAVVVELDEMWHFLKKSGTSSGSGRLGIVLPDGSSTGSWAVVTRPPSTTSRAPEALGRPSVLHRRLGGLRRADPARAPLRRQGGDARDRARPLAAAALAGPVPAPHLRRVQGRAHGRGLDRAFVRFGDERGIGELLSMLA